jgi:hypothetical protein
MKGIIEYLKKEVERGNVKIVKLEETNDIIIFDMESKEFMIFSSEDIQRITSLNFRTEFKS